MTKSKEKEWFTIHVQLHKHNAQLSEHHNNCKPHVRLTSRSAPLRTEMVIRIKVLCDIVPCRLVMS